MPTPVAPVIRTFWCSAIQRHVRELADERAVEAAARAVVEVFETGLRHPQLRLLQAARERAVVAIQVLGIDEHAEALVEAEGRQRRVLVLREIGVGHGAEAQVAQPVEGRRSS